MARRSPVLALIAVVTIVVMVACSASGEQTASATTSSAAPSTVQPSTVQPSTVQPSTVQSQTASSSVPPSTVPPSSSTTQLPAWPVEVTEPFLRGCTGVAGESACRCVLDQARASWSVDRLEELSADLAAGGDIPTDLVDLIEPCR